MSHQPKPTSVSTPATTGQQRVPLARVAALYRIGEALLHTTSEAEAFATAAQMLVSEAQYGNAWILTVDREAQLLRSQVGLGIAMDDTIASLTFPLSEPAVHTTVQAVLRGEPIILADVVARADQEGWGEIARASGIRSAAYVPFGPASAPLGVIVVSMLTDMDPTEETTLVGLFALQLTTALGKLRYDQERSEQIEALQAASAEQSQLLETIRDLSTPAIPVYEGILVMPLVGHLDTGRAGQLMEGVLTSIVREQATVVILDITAVPMIDTSVANHLLQVTQAAQLLGARCILVGIKPEVAHTLVMLGVDLSTIVTRANLQSGVAYALAQHNLRIVATEA